MTAPDRNQRRLIRRKSLLRLMMRFVKGVYIGSVDIKHDDNKIELHVWMNPETRKFFAVDHMGAVPVPRNYVNDPYDDGFGVVFENTFSGLPK